GTGVSWLGRRLVGCGRGGPPGGCGPPPGMLILTIPALTSRSAFCSSPAPFGLAMLTRKYRPGGVGLSRAAARSVACPDCNESKTVPYPTEIPSRLPQLLET